VADSREDTVTYAEEVDGGRPTRSPARTIIAVVLAIIAILAIIAGILYFTELAKSLPSVLGQLHGKRGRTHRSLRGTVAVIIGVVLLIAAGFTFLWKPKDR
jgi:hypothetical protein